MVVLRTREQGSGDQRGFAGDRHTGRFHGDERKEKDEPVVEEELRHASSSVGRGRIRADYLR